VHATGLGAWGFRLAFDEGFLDEYLGADIGEFAPLPRLHLFAHGLEVALHSVDPDRNAINQRERLRMLRKHRRKRAEDNVSGFELGHEDMVPPKVFKVRSSVRSNPSLRHIFNHLQTAKSPGNQLARESAILATFEEAG
jgi:hypothetical protein